MANRVLACKRRSSRSSVQHHMGGKTAGTSSSGAILQDRAGCEAWSSVVAGWHRSARRQRSVLT
jgi:hypothetical protein